MNVASTVYLADLLVKLLGWNFHTITLKELLRKKFVSSVLKIMSNVLLDISNTYFSNLSATMTEFIELNFTYNNLIGISSSIGKTEKKL